jgi:5-methylcytosine-specific restriction endonuclease McrA
MKRNTDVAKMYEFFLSVWKKRPHRCEGCNKPLGREPASYMFDHLLEKNKYPELAYDENNIAIVCLECHDNKTRGFANDIIKERIRKAHEYYERTKQRKEE